MPIRNRSRKKHLLIKNALISDLAQTFCNNYFIYFKMGKVWQPSQNLSTLLFMGIVISQRGCRGGGEGGEEQFGPLRFIPCHFASAQPKGKEPSLRRSGSPHDDSNQFQPFSPAPLPKSRSLRRGGKEGGLTHSASLN